MVAIKLRPVKMDEKPAMKIPIAIQATDVWVEVLYGV